MSSHTGDNITRCPACHELSLEHTTGLCDNPACRYAEACTNCGEPLDADDYSPDQEGTCTTWCRREARQAEAAGR